MPSHPLLSMVGVEAARSERLIRDLLSAVAAWRGDEPAPDSLPEFDDDVTAVLIRPNALAPRRSLALDVLALWRIVSRFARSLVDRGTVASWPQFRREVIAGTLFGGPKASKPERDA